MNITYKINYMFTHEKTIFVTHLIVCAILIAANIYKTIYITINNGNH